MSLLHRLYLVSVFLFATCAALDGARDVPREPVPFATLRYDAPSGPVLARHSGPADGPRVVFVHGTPGDGRAWDAYLRASFSGWDAIALDRPGFGASAPAGHVASLTLQAAALEPLLVDRGGRWPVLVGHSLGAAIAARAAIEYPDRVGGIVLLAGSVDPALEELRWYNVVATPIEWLLSRSLRNANREVRALRPELVALEADIARIRCPVLVMHGTRDSLVPPANVDFLQRRVQAPLEIVKLEGSDHFFIWTEFELVHAALERFLARVSGASQRAEGNERRGPRAGGR